MISSSMMSVRKTSVEIDEDLFETAREILATSTVKETIDVAFREVLRQEARRREVHALTTMEALDLDDDDVMAGAWRS